MRKRDLGPTLAVLTALAFQTIPAHAEDPAPQTVGAWLGREHRFLHRYLAVVQQATHDYSYGYKTPVLLMPVTIDLFTGYVARIHDGESRFLYPAIRDHMTSEQQKGLHLIEVEQEEEVGTVKSWQNMLEQLQTGQKTITEVADAIDYLGRLLNRHIVLQEQSVFPAVDTLTAKEQAAIVKSLEAFEREALGVSGRADYERLLAAIEAQIKAIAGRIW